MLPKLVMQPKLQRLPKPKMKVRDVFSCDLEPKVTCNTTVDTEGNVTNKKTVHSAPQDQAEKQNLHHKERQNLACSSSPGPPDVAAAAWS